MAETKTTDKMTPLMKQYHSIKAKYPETVLFFRMGDFFETFGEDAVTTSKVTGIVLTKRGNGSASEVELAGFPHHQLDSYLPKMIRAGGGRIVALGTPETVAACPGSYTGQYLAQTLERDKKQSKAT